MNARRTLARLILGVLVLTVLGASSVASAQAPRLRVGGDIKAPLKTKDVPPDYPDDARARRIQGLVILEIVIATDGRVLDATVMRSVPALDAAAVAAVSQWEYKPTAVNGELVELTMVVTINFHLAETPAE